MATTRPPNNIPIARPAMSPEVYLGWDKASTCFSSNFQLQVGWSIIQTCMRAKGTNCGDLLELYCTVDISLTPVRKSLLGAPHHDAEICVLVSYKYVQRWRLKIWFRLEGPVARYVWWLTGFLLSISRRLLGTASDRTVPPPLRCTL